MIETAVKNRQGAQVETFSFDEGRLGGKIRKRLLKQAVIMYLANKRQGNASTKTRGEVSGSRKKLWRQKGTGRARIGMRRAPQRKGGGVVWGPHPRDFRRDLPRKARQLATRNALLSKFMDGQVVVVDQLRLPEVKTKAMAAFLKDMNIERSCLVVVPDHVDGADIVRAARNLPRVTVMSAGDLNTYDILKHQQILMSRQTAGKLVEGEVAS